MYLLTVYYFVVVMFFIDLCYCEKDVNTPEPKQNDEVRNEKRFPNGTVVGRYSYKDKHGNPINVRYFADGSSYGVELKSFKIFRSKPESADNQFAKLQVMLTPDAADETSQNVLSQFQKTFNKDNSRDTYGDMKRWENVKSLGGNPLSKPDYELFTENNEQPDVLNAEKIRIYHGNYKRRNRRGH